MNEDNFIDSLSIYANRFSFMGRPLSRNPEAADVFVVGLPYDLGTSGRAGTRGGPDGIRSASANLRWEEKRWPWDFSVFERMRVADYGDIEVPTGNHEAFFAQVAEDYGKLHAAGKTVLSLGVDQALARCMVKHAAVVVDRIFLFVSVGVRIEVNHRHLAELAVVRAQ